MANQAGTWPGGQGERHRGLVKATSIPGLHTAEDTGSLNNQVWTTTGEVSENQDPELLYFLKCRVFNKNWDAPGSRKVCPLYWERSRPQEFPVRETRCQTYKGFEVAITSTLTPLDWVSPWVPGGCIWSQSTTQQIVEKCWKSCERNLDVAPKLLT
jgi:hypothetical protein